MNAGSCVIGILALLCLVKEACSLQCYHCGWSHDRKKYQRISDDDDEDLPYPVVDTKRYIVHTTAEEAELSRPPSRSQVERYCRLETCNLENSACVKWSFISNHPINVTYMCVGNPTRSRGCYQQVLNAKEFLKIEVCLCNNKPGCNTGTPGSSLSTMVALSTVIVMFALL